MNLFKRLWAKLQPLILYGGIMALLVFLLKWLQWKYIISDNSFEVYVGLLALLFTGLGVWVALQLTKSRVKTVVVEREVYVPAPIEFIVNEQELQKLNLTDREYEVLQQLSKGHSNAAIAENLCLSLSTVKTHVSNLFVKMDVKSRAQAIEKAKRLKITP